jgi:hypothetical protein
MQMAVMRTSNLSYFTFLSIIATQFLYIMQSFHKISLSETQLDTLQNEH